MCGSLYFAVFYQKLEQKVRFQTEFEKKPRIIQWLFSKMLRFLCEVHGENVDFTHKMKKNKNVRFSTEIEQKPYIIQRQFSQNVTFFYEKHILFF